MSVTKHARATCAVCGRTMATRADGMMGVHWSPDKLCPGSGRPPSGKERGE